MGTPELGTRILVVEDEWLIAEFFGDILREQGYEVMGPASNVQMAQELIEQESPAAAILDLTLGDEMSFPIAQMLTQRGIPFMFVSGHSDQAVLSEFQHVPLMVKPLAGEKLPAAIQDLLTISA